MFNRQNYLFKEVDRISSKACNMYQLIDVFILIHNNSCIVKKEQEKIVNKKKYTVNQMYLQHKVFQRNDSNEKLIFF